MDETFWWMFLAPSWIHRQLCGFKQFWQKRFSPSTSNVEIINKKTIRKTFFCKFMVSASSFTSSSVHCDIHFLNNCLFCIKWSSAVIAHTPLATTFFRFLFTTIPISSYLSVTYTSLETSAINYPSTELPPTDFFSPTGEQRFQKHWKQPVCLNM